MITESDVTQLIPNLSGVSPLSKGGQKIVFKADHTKYGGVVVKLIVFLNTNQIKKAQKERMGN